MVVRLFFMYVITWRLTFYIAGYRQSQSNRGQSNDTYGSNTQDSNGSGRTKDSQSSGGYGGQGDTQGSQGSQGYGGGAYGGGDQCKFPILWLRMLIKPLLDGGQSQSDYGTYQGSGGGATGGGDTQQWRSGSGTGGQSYGDDTTSCRTFFFSLSI